VSSSAATWAASQIAGRVCLGTRPTPASQKIKVTFGSAFSASALACNVWI
jgi:hypothetical protein